MVSVEQGLEIIVGIGVLPHQLDGQGGSPCPCPSMSRVNPPQHPPSLSVSCPYPGGGGGNHWASSSLGGSRPCLGGRVHVQCLGDTTGYFWPRACRVACAWVGAGAQARRKPSAEGSLGKWEEGVVQTQCQGCFPLLFCIKRSISCLIHLKIPHFSVRVFGKNRSL